MLEFNNVKNANKLHDFLIVNDCKPISLKNNAEYDSELNLVKPATKIWIEIEYEKEQQLIDLVEQFMSE